MRRSTPALRGYVSSGALPPRNRSPSSRLEASRRWVVFCPLMAARESRPLVLAAGVSARTYRPLQPAQYGGFPRSHVAIAATLHSRVCTAMCYIIFRPLSMLACSPCYCTSRLAYDLHRGSLKLDIRLSFSVRADVICIGFLILSPERYSFHTCPQ